MAQVANDQFMVTHVVSLENGKGLCTTRTQYFGYTEVIPRIESIENQLGRSSVRRESK